MIILLYYECNKVLISCRLFSQTELFLAPSSDFATSCESAQPRHWKEVIFYTQVQWALTFPILRRHCFLQLSPASFLLLKGFYELCCVFRLPTNNLYQPVSPICLVASYLWVVDQYVTCAPIRMLFPQRYF